jgi:hypothetical protein
MDKNQIVRWIGFSFAFILCSLVGCEACAIQAPTFQGDTLVDLAIESTIGLPGKFAEVSVLVANEVPIVSFKIQILLAGWDVANFHTDSIRVDSVEVPVDTCPGIFDTCLVDTCYNEPDSICMEWNYLPVRYCYIDTVGSLISDFETISNHGFLGDTSRPDCKLITVVGIAPQDSSISADPSYRLLFKFGVDLFCMCDADTERNAQFVVSPGFSFFADTSRDTVTFKYHMGELFPWAWSVPGDANNDSGADLADAVYMLNYLFIDGPPPCVWEAGDANANGEADLSDVVYIIGWLYLGGPPPQPGLACPELQPGIRINGDFEHFEH